MIGSVITSPCLAIYNSAHSARWPSLMSTRMWKCSKSTGIFFNSAHLGSPPHAPQRQFEDFAEPILSPVAAEGLYPRIVIVPVTGRPVIRAGIRTAFVKSADRRSVIEQ